MQLSSRAATLPGQNPLLHISEIICQKRMSATEKTSCRCNLSRHQGAREPWGNGAELASDRATCGGCRSRGQHHARAVLPDPDARAQVSPVLLQQRPPSQLATSTWSPARLCVQASSSSRGTDRSPPSPAFAGARNPARHGNDPIPAGRTHLQSKGLYLLLLIPAAPFPLRRPARRANIRRGGCPGPPAINTTSVREERRMRQECNEL